VTKRRTKKPHVSWAALAPPHPLGSCLLHLWHSLPFQLVTACGFLSACSNFWANPAWVMCPLLVWGDTALDCVVILLLVKLVLTGLCVHWWFLSESLLSDDSLLLFFLLHLLVDILLQTRAFSLSYMIIYSFICFYHYESSRPPSLPYWGLNWGPWISILFTGF
jgi:hypothetical protein